MVNPDSLRLTDYKWLSNDKNIFLQAQWDRILTLKLIFQNLRLKTVFKK